MCQKCNKEVLVDLGRQVMNCSAHQDLWCSCKVRHYLDLLGLVEVEIEENEDEVRYVTSRFPKDDRDHRLDI